VKKNNSRRAQTQTIHFQQQHAGNHHLLTETEAAEYLSLQPTSLRRWRLLGKGPRFCRIGSRAIRYTMESLEAFLADCIAATPGPGKEVRNAGN
jgi:hypothetical protein